MTAPPAGVEVATPGDWVELDLDQLADPALAAALVDDRVDAVDGLAAHRDDLVDVFTRAGEQARGAGVVFAAMLADERGGSPLLASLTLLAFVPADGDGGGEPIDLACGPARRLEEVHRAALAGDTGELAVLIVRYLVPVPGTDTVSVLSFSSPTIRHRGELVPTFHAIADSLRFRWEQDGAAS